MMDAKRRALKQAKLFNEKGEQVCSALFDGAEFFDPYDKLQVKYEMLRSHQVAGLAVARAAALFGFSRQAFYQIQEALNQEGMAGLLGRKRGRRGPTKCKPEVVVYLEQQKEAEPELSGRELAERLFQEHGIRVHRRTAEKIVAGRGRKKKRQREQ